MKLIDINSVDMLFLIIKGYTLYFWYVASHLSIVLGAAVAGGSALWLVFWFEKQRKEKQAET